MVTRIQIEGSDYLDSNYVTNKTNDDPGIASKEEWMLQSDRDYIYVEDEEEEERLNGYYNRWLCSDMNMCQLDMLCFCCQPKYYYTTTHNGVPISLGRLCEERCCNFNII